MKRRISILIIAFVLFAIPAWAIYQSSTFGNSTLVGAPAAGPSFVGIGEGQDDAGGTNISTSTSLTVSSGDTIIAFVAGQEDVALASCVCGSNNLVEVGHTVVSGYRFQVWYLENASATTSPVVATYSAGGVLYRRIVAANYSGIATASALDQNSCESAGCNALASSSANKTAQNVTTTQASELLVFCGINWNNNGTFSGANSFNLRSTSTGVNWFFADKNVSSTGSYPNATAVTDTAADTYLSLFVTLKAQ